MVDGVRTTQSRLVDASDGEFTGYEQPIMQADGGILAQMDASSGAAVTAGAPSPTVSLRRRAAKCRAWLPLARRNGCRDQQFRLFVEGRQDWVRKSVSLVAAPRT